MLLQPAKLQSCRADGFSLVTSSVLIITTGGKKKGLNGKHKETISLQTSALLLLLCWRTNRMKTCSWAGVQWHGNESCFMQGWSVKLRKLKRSGQPVAHCGDTLVFWVSGTKINYGCHMEGTDLCRNQLLLLFLQKLMGKKTILLLIWCITEMKDFHFKMEYICYLKYKTHSGTLSPLRASH